METAISIEEGLYRKAERLSTKLPISRCRIFAQALEYPLQKSETFGIIQKVNAAYGPNVIEKGSAIKARKKKMMPSTKDKSRIREDTHVILAGSGSETDNNELVFS